MTDVTIGFLLAITCSISFGAYILPRKLSKLSVLDYQYWVSLTIAPAMILIALLTASPLWVETTAISLGLLCGVLWTFGSLSYSAAVDNIGVTRSTPVKNLAPAFAAFYGIVFFNEYVITQPRELSMTLGGVALMVLAAYFIGRAGAQEHERARAFDVTADANQRKQSFKLGILYSLSAAFFYGAYSVPLKWLFKHDVSPYTACAWLGIGVLASTVVAYAIKTKRLLPAWPGKREAALGATAGGIWTSGQIVGALAMLYIPMSISWPVSNLGTLVAIGWGVMIFKEVRIEKHKLEFAASLVVYVAGLALLALAAPAGKM